MHTVGPLVASVLILVAVLVFYRSGCDAMRDVVVIVWRRVYSLTVSGVGDDGLMRVKYVLRVCGVCVRKMRRGDDVRVRAGQS